MKNQPATIHRNATEVRQAIFGLGKESMIYGIGSVITRFIGLFTLPLFTAYLKPEEYGVLAMLALLTMIAQPLFSLGLSAAMGPSYFESDNLLNKSKVVWTVFLINIVSAVILIAIAWLFPVMLGQLVLLPTEYTYLVGISLTGCALTVLATSFTQRVQFEKQSKLYVMITLATVLIATLVSAITVVFLEWGVKGMVIGQLAGNIVTFFAFLLIGLKATKPAVDFIMVKELLRLGLPLVPSFALLFILMHANKFILESQLGLDAVGIYSIGFNLGMAIGIVTNGVATAWYPFFMSYINRQSEAREIFARIFTYYFIGAGFLCLLFFLAAKPAVMLLTTDAFHDAYAVVGFVAMAFFFQTLFSLLTPGLYFNREVRYVTLLQFLAVLFSLPINYVLIAKMGVIGAAIGLAIGNCLMAVILYCWNVINRSRYLIILYEWKRIFSFIFFAFWVNIIYLQLPEITTLGEVTKSIVIVMLAISSMYFLLNNKEKLFLIKMATKK